MENIRIYHGGPAPFTQFDYQKIQTNGTSEGLGFYFSDKKAIAENYAANGYLITATFKGTKSLDPKNVTIPKSAFKAFLSALDKDNDYLSNWGDVASEGYQYVLNKAIENEYAFSTNDVDLIAGVCNASGDTELTLRLCYEILGFDSIVTRPEWGNGQTIYIALVHEAYEILSCEPYPQP